jgi:hypothetical protein
MTGDSQKVRLEKPADTSKLTPILITLLCSLVLAVGSCFAAWQTNTIVSVGWIFFMGIFLLTTISFIVACVRAVRISIHKKR